MISAVATPRTLDAVVVVPGIMGSELVDADGKVVWGLSPKVLARAWVTGQVCRLVPTDEELAGSPRLRPTRLLRVPGYMPFLGGLEPYGGMLNRARAVAVDDRAVAEFPYDWRLSIKVSAPRLVTSCQEHLDRWRAIVTREKLGDPAEVRLVIVAHSMGGLVTAYATRVLGLREVLGRVITAGTPYFGAVKAVEMLATGHGAPVPRRAARKLARRCPGVYDLLPRYRCVSEGTGLRVLSADDVGAVRGDRDLARAAEGRWEQLLLRQGAPPPVPWTTIVGKEQPTKQSLTITSGACDFLESLAGVDHSGDSTVYRGAATPLGVQPIALPQKHGALLKAPEVHTLVTDLLLGQVTRPPLGTRPVGADIPDMVPAGDPVVVTVSGTGGDPIGVSVSSTDLDQGASTTWAAGVRRDDKVRFSSPVLRAGLHRVQVKAGGFSAVTDIVLVGEGQP